MPKWPDDILDKIRSSFPDDAELVASMLYDFESTGVHERFRVARCILHLSGSNLEEFRQMHKAACQDYRDVIWWAEYDHPEDPDDQIHDFNNTFEAEGT